MSKYLLREFYELCPNGTCEDLLTEDDKRMIRENGAMFLTGVMQRADAQNGNGRVYPKGILEREIENYSKIVKERRALGELDHPDDSVVNLKNASHMITDVWWDGNDVMGKTIVEDDFQLICFDFVSEPSTSGAFMMTEGKNIDLNKVFTKADKINRALNEIIKGKE